MRISFDVIDGSDDAAVGRFRSMELCALGLARVTPLHPSNMDYHVSVIVTPEKESELGTPNVAIRGRLER